MSSIAKKLKDMHVARSSGELEKEEELEEESIKSFDAGNDGVEFTTAAQRLDPGFVPPEVAKENLA